MSAISDICENDSQIQEKLDYHKSGVLELHAISGKSFNETCLKDVVFQDIRVTGLQKYDLW